MDSGDDVRWSQHSLFEEMMEIDGQFPDDVIFVELARQLDAQVAESLNIANGIYQIICFRRF